VVADMPDVVADMPDVVADMPDGQDGRIVERGGHELLLARGGRYAEWYVTRFGEETAAA
jgi:hypothetical protein